MFHIPLFPNSTSNKLYCLNVEIRLFNKKSDRMKKVFMIAAVALLLVTCESEPEAAAIDSTQLTGKWELVEASRNGDATNTLADLYFEFDDAGSLNTNMPTMEGASKYELDDNEIEQEGNGFEQDYTIESLTEQELVLTTKIQDYDFRMVFAKITE